MANEPYIKRLEREKKELAEVIKRFNDVRDALNRFNNTAYKGDARKGLEDADRRLNEALKQVEPILADMEEKNG